MPKQYKWRTTFNYQNNPGPNYHLSYGVIPSTYDTWQTADVGVPGSSGEITYYYRDSNTMYAGQWVDTISSRVAFKVTQTWTATADVNNNLTIVVSTVINSIDRDDIMGNDQNTPGRNIDVYKEAGGAASISITDTQVATAHNLSGPVNLGSYTFTLAPGQNLTKNTLFVHNQTIGSQSYDDIWGGIQFQNPLPADYVPGAILSNGQWLSHNRVNGDLRMWNGARWTNNLRTLGGPSDMGNPPSSYHGGKWYNMIHVGKE